MTSRVYRGNSFSIFVTDEKNLDTLKIHHIIPKYLLLNELVINLTTNTHTKSHIPCSHTFMTDANPKHGAKRKLNDWNYKELQSYPQSTEMANLSDSKISISA